MAEQNEYGPHIEHGSDEHMQWLGLRKARKDDDPELVVSGYTLETDCLFGVTGWTKEQLLGVLKQKVSGFLTKPEPVQSEDPNAEGYAPPMWTPYEEPGEEPSGII